MIKIQSHFLRDSIKCVGLNIFKIRMKNKRRNKSACKKKTIAQIISFLELINDLAFQLRDSTDKGFAPFARKLLFKRTYMVASFSHLFTQFNKWLRIRIIYESLKRYVSPQTLRRFLRGKIENTHKHRRFSIFLVEIPLFQIFHEHVSSRVSFMHNCILISTQRKCMQF